MKNVSNLVGKVVFITDEGDYNCHCNGTIATQDMLVDLKLTNEELGECVVLEDGLYRWTTEEETEFMAKEIFSGNTYSTKEINLMKLELKLQVNTFQKMYNMTDKEILENIVYNDLEDTQEIIGVQISDKVAQVIIKDSVIVPDLIQIKNYAMIDVEYGKEVINGLSIADEKLIRKAII